MEKKVNNAFEVNQKKKKILLMRWDKRLTSRQTDEDVMRAAANEF